MEMDNENIENDGLSEETLEEESNPNRQQVEARIKWVTKAKTHWQDTFNDMRDNMKFARGIQWPGQKDSKDKETRYIANVVLRHLRQREAALYAKNPTAVAKRRETLDFTIYDGNMDTVMQAQQSLMQMQQMQMQMQQMAAQGIQPPPMDPAMMQMVEQAKLLIEDYQIGSKYRTKITAMGKTLEIVWRHQIGEQIPPFKRSMKHLVLRALTTGVGYVKLGYHRFNEPRPEDATRVTDLTEQVAALEAMQAEAQEDEAHYSEESAELSDLKDLTTKLQSDPEVFMREGLDFDYPKSTSIIVDPACYDLDGFLGARWVAQEFLLTARQIQETYKVDIDDKFLKHDDQGAEFTEEASENQPVDQVKDTHAKVYEIWDKHHGQTYTVCEGYPDYLVAPKTPSIKLERFWPFFTLIFNSIEEEKGVYPPSDVSLIKPMQVERNLMRQRVREHRDAARPGHVASRGRLDEEDKSKLQNRQAHDVVELNGLAEQDDIRRIIQPIPTSPLDPNQYETGPLDDDLLKSVGSQEAVLGGSSGASATESSIGESARLSSIGSNIDDLDDFLSDITKSASHMLFTEMSTELVVEIAGRGAVWPELSGPDVARDLWLEVRAGSSGRPNKAAEIQNMERIMPFLLQIPGLKPKKLAEKLMERLDDRMDIDEMYDANLPSVISQNGQSQVSTGDAATDPNQQGPEGASKTAVNQGDTNLGPRMPEQPRVMDPNR